MPTISIAYRFPVHVLVDTDRGQVLRVVVDDEAGEPEPDGYCEDARTGQKAAQADVDEAYVIACDSAWPRWTFGW